VGDQRGSQLVHGFDHDYSALIMTVRPREAKRFVSHREAELWVNRYGKDLESYSILNGEQLRGFGPRSSDLALMRVSERGSWGLAQGHGQVSQWDSPASRSTQGAAERRGLDGS
jgi:hypothetical protein